MLRSRGRGLAAQGKCPAQQRLLDDGFGAIFSDDKGEGIDLEMVRLDDVLAIQGATMQGKGRRAQTIADGECKSWMQYS